MGIIFVKQPGLTVRKFMDILTFYYIKRVILCTLATTNYELPTNNDYINTCSSQNKTGHRLNKNILLEFLPYY